MEFTLFYTIKNINPLLKSLTTKGFLKTKLTPHHIYTLRDFKLFISPSSNKLIIRNSFSYSKQILCYSCYYKELFSNLNFESKIKFFEKIGFFKVKESSLVGYFFKKGCCEIEVIKKEDKYFVKFSVYKEDVKGVEELIKMYLEEAEVLNRSVYPPMECFLKDFLEVESRRNCV